MRKGIWVILAAALVVLVLGLITGFVPRGRKQVEPYRTDVVQRGDIRVQISATGTLNAVTTVQVGSQITGTIAGLYADFNSTVQKGQVLAQIDPTFLKAQVAQSEADLEKANVNLHQTERDFARAEPLREQGLASQADIDAAQTALEAARASVKSAEAALLRARTNLQYATISSPIDGIVVSRDVDVGQTVAASLSAPTLFTIANDLTRMQLEASVDEADIGMVKVGQHVDFTVDAFPDRTFSGTVHQIRLAPRTEQNVVSYTVIVLVPNDDLSLLPGMTANATFLVDEVRDVLKVPTAALRFHPPATGKEQGKGDGRREGPGHPGTADSGRRMGGPGGPSSGERPGGESSLRTLYLPGEGGRLRPLRVRTGLSDGTWTAVLSDSLSEGMSIVVGSNRPTGEAGQQQVNPFMPRRPSGRR